MSTFAERLEELIGDMTVAAFARQCGLPPMTLRSNLKGIDPGRKTLAAIAEGAGVSIDWLVTGNGDKYGKEPILGALQGRGNLLIKAIGGIEGEAEKAALLDELQAWVQKEKQFSEMKKQLGKRAGKKRAG